MNCSVEEAKVKISDLLGDRIDIAESIANILENGVKDKIVFDTKNVKSSEHNFKEKKIKDKTFGSKESEQETNNDIAYLIDRVSKFKSLITNDKFNKDGTENINTERSKEIKEIDSKGNSISKKEYLKYGNPFSQWTTNIKDDYKLSKMYYDWIVDNKIPESYIDKIKNDTSKTNNDLKNRLYALEKTREYILNNLENIAGKKLYYNGTARGKDLSHALVLAYLADAKKNNSIVFAQTSSKKNDQEINAISSEPGGIKKDFDYSLNEKMKEVLQKLYPEIKLEYTDNIQYADSNGNIMNQEEVSNIVKYSIKIAESLYDLSTAKPSKHGEENHPVLKTVKRKNETWLRKKLSGKGVSKDQIDFMFEYMDQNDIKEIDTSDLADKLLIGFAQNVEINKTDGSHYGYLTAPGGINYKEVEILTPSIKADLKGHAKFSTDEGIGWYRMDDEATGSSIQKLPDVFTDSQGNEWKKIKNVWTVKYAGDFSTIVRYDLTEADIKGIYPFDLNIKSGNKNGTLRILEMQSDLFQKRKKSDLRKNEYITLIEDAYKTITGDEHVTSKKAYDYFNNINADMIFEQDGIYIDLGNGKINLDKSFHQLLNTDNKWVKFFIKSIVQNAEKNGYKKIKFPTGNTIYNIEGFTEEDKSKGTMDFYDKNVKNTLVKEYGSKNIKLTTDEHGNKWFELSIDKERDSSLIMLQQIETKKAELQEGSNSLLVPIEKPNYINYLLNKVNGFDEKSEVHLTVLGFPQGKELSKIFTEDPKKRQLVEDLISKSDFSYIPTNDIYRIERDRESWIDWKDQSKGKEIIHEEAVIQLVKAPGVEIFINEINELLDTNFPVPFHHISLGVKGSKLGIGIADKSAFDKLSKEKIEYYVDSKKVILDQKTRRIIKGQANITAGTVLINSLLQTQDTLPHEYAHHYIAWFRETPIVKEAISKWGSEEALVQAIGEQAVKQKGDAWSWWKNFTKWIQEKFNNLSKIEKEEIKNILTDAFLTRADLNNIESSEPAAAMTVAEKNISYNKKLSLTEELNILIDALTSGSGISISGGMIENSQVDRDGYRVSDKDQDIAKAKVEKGQKQISIQDQLPKIEKSKIIQYRKSIEARTKFLSLSNKTIDKINKFMNNHQNNINELEEILSSIKSNVQLAESLGLEPHFKDNNEPLLPFETVKRGSTAKINNNDVKEDGDPFELDIDLADYLHANFSSMYKSEIDEYKDAKKKAAEEGDFTFKTKDMSYEQQMYDVSRMIVENLMENGLNKNLKVRFHRLTEDRYTRGTYTFGEDVGQEVTDPTFVSQGISYTINGGIIDIYYGKGYFDSSYEEVSGFRTDITLSEDYELILHEMLHSMIEKAYDQDKALNRSLFQLKEQVMKKLDYTVLLTKSVDDSTNEEIQLAKDIFEHMDNPTEFLAYASTNRNVFNAIKNMQIKNTLIGEFRPKRGEEIGKFKQLLNKFIQAVNKVYTAMTTGASAKAELDRIYASLLDINTKIETGSLDIRFDKKFRKYEAYGIGDKYKATNDWMLKAEDGILSTAKDIWSSDNIRNKSEAAGRFLENIWSWRRFNWIRDSRLISDLITDITEDTTGEDAAWFYKAVRNTKGNRERDKLDFAAVMKSKVSEQFKDFTEDERSAVTYMLQGDWLALNVDIQEYKNMLENESIVRARIDELKKMINVPEYANQSAFLGYYMINQEAKGSAMLKNAFQIYYRFHMGKHSSPIQNKYTPEQNIKMIDELASLYAIMYTEKEIKQKIVDSINRDADVVSFASNTYYSYRKDEISGQLSDFAIFTDKGYVRKSSSVNMKFDIVPESKIIKNSKFNFLNHKVIRKRDDIKELMDEAGLNPNGEDYYMVVERDTDPARTQGVLDDISIIDTGSEFTSYTAGRNLDFKQVQELREQRFKKDRTHLNSYIDDSLESLRARDNYSVAEFDISGHIDFYSSPISEADKKLYGRSIDDIAEVIGNTTSHISTKEKALLNNQRFIDLLIEDSKRNIGSDGYVFLSPDSGDKELDTYWAMIPDYSRHYIMSSTNEKGIWVKRSRINNIVGYKDPSISNMKLFGLRLEDYPQLQKALKIVEHTWKEISSSYKEIIVKLMPDVVIGNASSNMFIAMRHGIGGIEYAKAFRDAWSELSEYMELNKELISLKIDEKTGVSGVKTKIKELESRLERNGMHPLIKDGQFSMIFEDIDVDIMKKSTHLKDVIMSASEKKFGKEFTENLDEIRQNIYITKDTRGHRAIEKLTLFNDIINKKIIMDKMMQDLKYKTFASEEAKKSAEEDVINYVDQLFVNYSYLTNKYVKWASDLNLILFIKYFLRAGKASLNMMKRQPLGSAIAESIDTFIWNMPDPIDQYMSPVDTLASKIGLSPFEVILEIMSPNIINPFK